MSKRYVVLGLSLVLALTLAVPAFGGPSNPVGSISASVKSTAKKALSTAKKARKEAKAAQTSADAAQSSANGAKTAADAAQTSANGAKATADAAAAAAAAAQATADTKFSTSHHVENTASGANLAAVACDSGRVTGGGFTLGGGESNEAVVTLNTDYGNGWIVNTIESPGETGTWNTTANAVCATP